MDANADQHSVKIHGSMCIATKFKKDAAVTADANLLEEAEPLTSFGSFVEKSYKNIKPC